MMQRLSITLWNYFGHTLDVTTRSLQKALKVSLRLDARVAGARSEEGGVLLVENQEPTSQLLQGSWDMGGLSLMALSGVTPT